MRVTKGGGGHFTGNRFQHEPMAISCVMLPVPQIHCKTKMNTDTLFHLEKQNYHSIVQISMIQIAKSQNSFQKKEGGEYKLLLYTTYTPAPKIQDQPSETNL